MAALFSVFFTGVFIAFGIAAILGHVLVAEALLRPFPGKFAIDTRPAITSALPASR